ncbi:glutamyl aminopeptidase-like isoform X1 [Bombyx mori]|uniref:Aminopeptidase n=1 Tax=Bombyx mori TaxID=7091 RepID=A0A8R1WJ70_BOMMO|nr:glutamyl aminopeptidase-like isoform X1 [Bombyx mori]XP_021203227.1 glutamyl aminopeptidase-like isoform X1 [Bombyx mori]
MSPKLSQCLFRNNIIILLGLLSFSLIAPAITLTTFDKRSKTCESDDCVPMAVREETNLSNVTENANYYRLPNNILPKNYNLTLKPNMKDNIFKGTVNIAIEVLTSTNKITMHAYKLTIESVILKDSKNVEVSISSINISTDKRELLRIHLNDQIQRGKYNVEIVFQGNMDKKIIGFYSSSLKNGGTMVASKFQPTYARQAFPCFDEPDFKATYDIALVKPEGYVALSNMNEISVTRDPSSDLETVKFATSVPMSTYLACFVVCDFGYKDVEINTSGIGNTFKLRSFAQKNELHKIDFAQDIGKRATEFYIRYYEVEFPLPKLDMIAIPDYISGATEHWGLITYRETSFLVDEATASVKNKISIANTIAHELAHMWFGNLVTMKWWDEVWLNEGFASYMQVKSLNAIEPSWAMLDQFLTKTVHPVLVTDAKLSSHPIVQTVSTPDQITSIFDTISYNKGASILRMLEGFIGEENFRRGVSDYLKKFQYGNTVTQDLLSCLEVYFKQENPDLSLTHIMDTWTQQMGYPLLYVEPGNGTNTYVVTQKRFLLDPDAEYTNDSKFNYRWYVPITYKTNKGNCGRVIWFPDTVESVTLNLDDNIRWLKINNNQIGYYRVHYADEMWQNLILELNAKSKELTISDRAHLLDDAFALAEAGSLPYNIALDLTTYLTVEDDEIPWTTAVSIFGGLARRLLNTPAYDDLKSYIHGLVKPVYEKQSWEKVNIGVIERLLRARILTLATRYQLPDAEDKVRNLFLSWLNGHGTPDAVVIEPDLRDFVYYYGMRSATQQEWDKLWEIYLKETDVLEATKIRSALSASRDANILKRYLELSWDEANIRSQDYLNVLADVSDNPTGTGLVWDDVRTRWPQLVDRFTLNSRYLGGLITSITKSFSTQQKLNEMEAFFAQYPEAGAGEASRKRALETVHNNIKWSQKHRASVAAWLEKRRS